MYLLLPRGRVTGKMIACPVIALPPSCSAHRHLSREARWQRNAGCMLFPSLCLQSGLVVAFVRHDAVATRRHASSLHWSPAEIGEAADLPRPSRLRVAMMQSAAKMELLPRGLEKRSRRLSLPVSMRKRAIDPFEKTVRAVEIAGEERVLRQSSARRS